MKNLILLSLLLSSVAFAKTGQMTSVVCEDGKSYTLPLEKRVHVGGTEYYLQNALGPDNGPGLNLGINFLLQINQAAWSLICHRAN